MKLLLFSVKISWCFDILREETHVRSGLVSVVSVYRRIVRRVLRGKEPLTIEEIESYAKRARNRGTNDGIKDAGLLLEWLNSSKVGDHWVVVPDDLYDRFTRGLSLMGSTRGFFPPFDGDEEIIVAYSQGFIEAVDLMLGQRNFEIQYSVGQAKVRVRQTAERIIDRFNEHGLTFLKMAQVAELKQMPAGFSISFEVEEDYEYYIVNLSNYDLADCQVENISLMIGSVKSVSSQLFSWGYKFSFDLGDINELKNDKDHSVQLVLE